MYPYRQILFALLAPLLLSSCLLTPGKFDSTLDIRGDRSFTFTYKGEVIIFDMAKEMTKKFPSTSSDEDKDELKQEGTSDSSFAPMDISADQAPKPGNDALKGEGDDETKMKAIADALSKETGYKSVRYVGNDTFLIDYEVHGTLDHAFVYPFNVDAEIVFPFIIVELRGKDMVRMKAPGFANSDSKNGGLGGRGSAGPLSKLDGTFTLITNAEIVSQNSEDGAAAAPGGRKIVWRATALTKDEPMAMLRVAPLP